MTKAELIQKIERHYGLRADEVEPTTGDAAIEFRTLTNVWLMRFDLSERDGGWVVTFASSQGIWVGESVECFPDCCDDSSPSIDENGAPF